MTDADAGSGSGVSTVIIEDSENRPLGESGGAATHQLEVSEMPRHHHLNNTDDTSGGTESLVSSNDSGSFADNDTRTQAVGGDLPHNNMPPYLTISYIIKT